LVGAVVVSLFVFQAVTVDPDAAAPTGGEEGILIFTDRHDDASATLWAFDLELGELHQGPEVPMPVELVDGYLAGEGWVGVTSQLGDVQRASVFPWFGPEALDAVLGQGELVGWTAGGQSVAAVRVEEAAAGRCDVLVVATASARTQDIGERYRGRNCGQPVALGRDALNPFLTLSEGGVFTTYEIPNRVEPLDVTPRSVLLGVGRDGDILLGMPRPGPPYEFLAVTDRLPGGLRRVTVGGELLSPEEVLGFSFDGEVAYVLGTAGGRRGIWEVPLDIGDQTEPGFVMDARSDGTWLTASFDRTIVVLSDGGLSISDGDGPFVDLEMPDDAPAVSGPILLVRSLSYSAP
jgi:hypothetical protein